MGKYCYKNQFGMIGKNQLKEGLYDMWDRLKRLASRCFAPPSGKNVAPVNTHPYVLEKSIRIPDDINSLYSKKLNEGLYPGEIILLDWLCGKHIESKPPQYFSLTYGLNWMNSIAKFKSTNLINTDFCENSLLSLKVTDLKNILSANNLKVSGKKNDLIQRITENIPEQKYINLVPKVYSVSSEGKRLLEKYDKLVWAHKKSNKYHDPSITVATFIPYVFSEKANESIALSISEESFRNHIAKKQYGMACNDLSTQIIIKNELGKLSDALTLEILFLLYEFSGLGNISINGTSYIDSRHIIFNYSKSSLIDLKYELKIEDNDIFQLASDIYNSYRNTLPSQILIKSDKEFINVIDTLLNENDDDMKRLINKLDEQIPNEFKFDYDIF